MVRHIISNNDRIKAIEYENCCLTVHLNDRSEWTHQGVLPEVFKELIFAQSIDWYYEENIEDNREYEHKKISM